MLITLMGKSGSGKTTIGRLLSKLNENIQVLDVDKIAHKVYENEMVRNKVIEVFGNKVLDESGNISRKELSKIVFNDKEKMKILCDITYSYIEKQIDDFISKNKIIVLDYALLPKTKYFDESDIRILVVSDNEKRNVRIQKRDNISEKDFMLRDKNSIDYSNLNFDYTIVNNNDIDTLEATLTDIYISCILPKII